MMKLKKVEKRRAERVRAKLTGKTRTNYAVFVRNESNLH
jgi:hypothetical protein